MFSQEKYLRALLAKRLGKRPYYFESLDSTNSFIINKDWHEGAMALADIQTDGKGRSGKNWVTVPGNACFSFAVTDLDKNMLMPLNLLAGFAVTDVLRRFAPVSLKWPNDCVCGGKKICGILLETSFAGDRLEKLAVGIGINLYDRCVPKVAGIPVTSLETLGADPSGISREEIIADIITRFEELTELLKEGNIAIEETWRGYSANIGGEISVTLSGEKRIFREKGVTAEGALLALDKYGRETVINSGEIGYDFGR